METKHKDAIKNLRETLKSLTEQKRETKSQILALKFDADGKPCPETGPQRDAIWRDYVWGTRPQARAIHLALGLLRGTPYKAMEAKHEEDNPPPIYGIMRAIHQAFGEDTPEWPLTRIQKLIIEGIDPMAKEAA